MQLRFAFPIICRHWDGEGSWHPFPIKDKDVVIVLLVNILTADDLATWGAKSSTDMVLAKSFGNIISNFKLQTATMLLNQFDLKVQNVSRYLKNKDPVHETISICPLSYFPWKRLHKLIVCYHIKTQSRTQMFESLSWFFFNIKLLFTVSPLELRELTINAYINAPIMHPGLESLDQYVFAVSLHLSQLFIPVFLAVCAGQPPFWFVCPWMFSVKVPRSSLKFDLFYCIVSIISGR